ncbi:hypothetical protein ACJJTC_008905 [Scirpophaga incertulas]
MVPAAPCRRASPGVSFAGKLCQLRVGQKQRQGASCGCSAAMFVPPSCRGAGAGRMRAPPARNPRVGNDATNVNLPGVMLVGVLLTAAPFPFASEAPVLAHRITAGRPRAAPAQGASLDHRLTPAPRSRLYKRYRWRSIPVAYITLPEWTAVTYDMALSADAESLCVRAASSYLLEREARLLNASELYWSGLGTSFVVCIGACERHRLVYVI